MQERQRHRGLDRVVHAMHRIGRQDDEVGAGRFELSRGVGHPFAERGPVVRALQRFDFGEVDRDQHALRVVMAAVQCLRVPVDHPVVLGRRFPAHAADQSDRLHPSPLDFVCRGRRV